MDIIVCCICIFLIFYFLLEDVSSGILNSLSIIFDRKKKQRMNDRRDSDITSEIASLVVLDHYLNR